MKSILQAIAGTALAILLGYMFVWVAKENLGLNPESVTLDEYNNYMLEAKSYFVDNSEELQKLGMTVIDMNGLRLLRGRSGSITALTSGGVEDASAALSALGAEDGGALADTARELMKGYVVDIQNDDQETLVSEYTQIQSISVTPEGIYFFTHYLPDGVVGFKYAKDTAAADGYSSIRMTDEWCIFYTIEGIE